MLYNPPTGSTDPNAGYVGKNVSAGIQGSRVPPQAVEATQREIVNAITAAGLSPTNTDLTQLSQAIKAFIQTALGGASNNLVWHFGQDTSASAAQIVADVTPNIAAYDSACCYRIKVANNSIAGGSQGDFDGRGLRTITRADGTAIRKGDWTAGQVIVLLDDGTRLQLAGVTTAFAPSSNIVTATSTTTFTVPAGVTALKRIRGWGAGGGGGGSTGANGAGSGAGGGGYFELASMPVAPNDVIALNVGAAGVGSSGNGTAGGTTSIGPQGQTAWAAATGGGAGSAGINGAQTSGAGLGGVGSGPGLNVTGGQGSYGSASPLGSGIGGAGAFGGGSPTPNYGVGFTNGNFPGGGANGGVGGSNGGTGGAGLIVFEF